LTKLIVNSGVCGFSVSVTAEKGKDRKIMIFLETECGMVRKMLEDISTLDTMAAFAGFTNNPVYRSAGRRLKHAACPVPAGILKALEVEAGLNVPKDVSIIFIKDKGEIP